MHVIYVTVTPVSVDSRRMSYDSSSGSRLVKAESGILRSPTVAVHPSMEGLVSFVPPELTERTLMHVGVRRIFTCCWLKIFFFDYLKTFNH